MNEPLTPPKGSVAYLLKGFPLISEIFIASEIHRVEQAGIVVRIFVIKPREEREHHPVVDRIRARPVYLPRTTKVSGTTRLRWLATNVRPFIPIILRMLRRRPAGVLRAAAFSFAWSLRSRRGRWSWPHVSYARAFLLGVAFAELLLEAPEVRHVHAHFAHESTTVTMLASMITGLPFSFTAHAKDIYSERLNPPGLLQRKLLAARFVVTCTEANRRHLQTIATTAVVHRIYHGLNSDFSRLLTWEPRAPSSDGILRVLSVGRLVHKKGFDVLVRACGMLRCRGIPFELTIVGDEDEVGDEIRTSDDIRELITSLGLRQDARVLGAMGQAELYDEYRRAEVFCLPCRVVGNGDRDGIPNVLMEAMACGIPVVTTGISGIPELIRDRVNGLLVPPEDPEAVAAALLLLHKDRELADGLSGRGQCTVRERFDGDTLAGQLAKLFEEVIE
jgi:glycosyltransferase involved in cell wall biosynthesis